MSGFLPKFLLGNIPGRKQMVVPDPPRNGTALQDSRQGFVKAPERLGADSGGLGAIKASRLLTGTRYRRRPSSPAEGRRDLRHRIRSSGR